MGMDGSVEGEILPEDILALRMPHFANRVPRSRKGPVRCGEHARARNGGYFGETPRGVLRAKHVYERHAEKPFAREAPNIFARETPGVLAREKPLSLPAH